MIVSRESLKRLSELDASLTAVLEQAERLQIERNELADAVMDRLESSEVTKYQHCGFVAEIHPGEPHLDWEREFTRVAKPEAIRRFKANAPRVPELVITRTKQR